LLGGLWHGAGWNFVLWGALHGTAIAAVTLWNAVVPKPARHIPAPLGWLLTFGFVTLAWVFFRSASIAGAMNMFQGLLILPTVDEVGGWRTVAIAAFCAIVLPPTHEIARRMTATPRAEVAIALAIAGIIVTAQIGRYENFEFIYFRF
jgi:alginate O-acetyltransferase complex protein AlgI